MTKKTLFTGVSLLLFVNLALYLGTYLEGVVINSDQFAINFQMYVKPFFWGTLPLTGVLGVLLILPIQYAHTWLRFVAWWYIPIAIYIVAITDTYGGSILQPSRTQAAYQLGMGLAAITVLQVVIQAAFAYIRRWMRKRTR